MRTWSKHPVIYEINTWVWLTELRDAAKDRIIAASDFFEPLNPGSLVTPGFGG